MTKEAWEHGIALFNDGQFWECHEALEAAWMQSDGEERDALHGVILLAAALHKARHMGSARGGRRNYAKALMALSGVPDVWRGVDIRGLEAVTHAALRDLAHTLVVPRREE